MQGEVYSESTADGIIGQSAALKAVSGAPVLALPPRPRANLVFV